MPTRRLERLAAIELMHRTAHVARIARASAERAERAITPAAERNLHARHEAFTVRVATWSVVFGRVLGTERSQSGAARTNCTRQDTVATNTLSVSHSARIVGAEHERRVQGHLHRW